MRTKIIAITVLLAIAVTMTGCNKKNKPPTTTLSGYELFEDSESGFFIQYPNTMIPVTASMTEEELSAVAQSLGVDADKVPALVLDSIRVMWYRQDEIGADFITRVNITIGDAEKRTSSMLKLKPAQEQFQAGLEEQYSKLSSEVKFLGDVEGVTYNERFFLLFKFRYPINGAMQYFFQYYTIENEHLYTITIGSQKADIKDAVPEIETMLETMEFYEQKQSLFK